MFFHQRQRPASQPGRTKRENDQDLRLTYPSRGVKGPRYLLRNFTALSVKEHLRSQLDGPESETQLTPNEVELVRFAADRSDELKRLADTSPDK